ncbi:hypothetical protein K438DRAFT_2011016 [Mycena galopus ATCC 62051]|nr:hypothetical protein K438DRAFT_2011016 [Mycena galopus ATCC 62051]
MSLSSVFTPSADESALVAQLFSAGEPHKLGVLTGQVALELFRNTNLSVEALSDIWAIADKDGRGWLSETQTAVALRLIGWAQAGVKAGPELLEKPGPLARIPDAPGAQQAVPSRNSVLVPPLPRRPNATAGPSRMSSFIPSPPPIPDSAQAGPSRSFTPIPPSVIPPITPEDKAKFHRLFASSGPVNGLIDGDRAREIFSKSKLSVEPLSQIWELSDIEGRGALDLKGFTVALHLIQGLMNNRLSTVPAFLPNELYEQAAGPVTEPSSPLSPSLTTPLPGTPPVDRRRSSSAASSNYLSARTENNRSVSPLPRYGEDRVQVPDWDIPPEVRTISDRQFDALDPLKSGFIHDNISLPFLLESKLPPEEVARIWALADQNNDGKLTREGFAVALYLVDERRRGNPIPSSPPPFLKTLDIPRSNGKQRQSQYPPEKAVNGQLNGQLSPLLSPSDNLQRQPSHLRYPSLPSHPNSNRFSSLWAPVSQPNFLGMPSSPTMTPSSPMMPTSPPAPPDAVAQLTRQVQEMQKLITQLRRSDVEKTTTIANLTQENVSLRVVVDELQFQAAAHDPASQKAVHEVLVRENEGLRVSVQELQTSMRDLQSASSDVEMQRIQYEDIVRENERLSECVREMRESTTQLPWSGGDSELQTLINEDLARENARLRTEAREMQENVAQLQTATAGFEEEQRLNAELTQEKGRMEGTIRAMQTSLDAQKTEVRQLTQEVDLLKTQLRTTARAPPTRRETDIPPPAYNELDATMIQ